MSEGTDPQCDDQQLSAVVKMNGSTVNGHSEESNHSNICGDLPTVDIAASLKDKLKGNMDGFEVVTRNSAEDENVNDNVNGSSENGGKENGVTVQNEESERNGDKRDPTPTPDHDCESSRESEPAPEDEPMEVRDESNEAKPQEEDNKAEEVEDKAEKAEEDAEDKKENTEEVHVLDESTGNICVRKDKSSNDQSEDTLTANSEEASTEESQEADNHPSVSVDKAPEKAEAGTSRSADEKRLQSEAHEDTTEQPTIKKNDASRGKEKSAAEAKSDDKPPPSPKKKKTKVDRMLENDKKQGSSASIGSEDLRPFSKLLFELGLDLSRQHVYKDLVKVQKKKRSHKLLNEKEEEQLDKLTEAYGHLVDKNDPYILDTKKCNSCFFHADTENALALHKEFEHSCMCAICGFVAQNIYAFYFHMEAEHNRQGRVQPVLGMYNCPYCPYEHHSAKKNFIKHVAKCETHFKLDRNLQPVPADCDIPLKYAPSQKQPIKPAPPPVKKLDARPLPPATRLPTAGNTGQGLATGPVPSSNVQAAAWVKAQEQQGPQLVQVGNQYFLVVQQNGQTFMTPMVGNTPIPQQPAAAPIAQPKPAPRPPAPAQGTSPQGGKFEICEICGGFVKDRESLRIHFFWAHKIEIHPSVMKESPGLKCRSCNQRLWTYQGYKRHITVTHPTTKEFLQHMTCYVCTSPVSDFITHMTSKHPQVVKHMLSQIRCVVCQDSFPTETALEAHMLVDHKQIVTKYGSLGSGGSAPNKPAGPIQGYRPKAVPTGLYSNSSAVKKCSRCAFQYSSSLAYRAHFAKSHSSQTEICQICKQDVLVGKPFIEHVAKEHLRDVKVSLTRLTPEIIRSCTLEETSRTSSKKRPAEDEVIVIDLDVKTPKKQRVENPSGEGDGKDSMTAEKRPHEDKPSPNVDTEVLNGSDKSNCSANDVDSDEDAEVDLEKVMEADEESNHSNQGEDSRESVTEEVMEVDGETVVVQKMND